MDFIFKALGDETRRRLLDRLRVTDGQTLTELEEGIGLSRFGVMKHLKVLEEAGLITTRRAGRFKHHHLNTAPLLEALDRWIEPMVQRPAATALLHLKKSLETPDGAGDNEMTDINAAPGPDETPDFIMETYIRTTPEALWDALTQGQHMARYHFAKARFEGEIEPGAPYRLVTPDGGVMLSGTILLVEPFERLAMTFVPGWQGDDAVASRNVYEIAPAGEAVKLRVLHHGLGDNPGIRDGWAKLVSKLKTYLETGTSFDIVVEDAA